MECVLAWHLYNCSIFQFTQLFIRDVPNNGQANTAVCFCVTVLQNVFLCQRANGLRRGGRRPISVWVVLHYVLDNVLYVLLLASCQHLQQAQRKPVYLDGAFRKFTHSLLRENVSQHHVLHYAVLAVCTLQLRNKCKGMSMNVHSSSHSYLGT